MIDMKVRLGTFRVKEIQHLTPETFILRTDKNHIDFTPGQRVRINMRNKTIGRNYSIYSAKDDPYLEFLIREVKEGYLTPMIKPLLPGDELEIFGPKGNFTLKKINLETDNVLFISTGTGIAPFHSMIKSYPGLNYRLIHGVQYSREAYNRNDFDPQRLTVCTSQERGSDFHGRITPLLKSIDIKTVDHVFLCGNRQMIDEVITLFLKEGFNREHIHSEVYF
jgi:ferredoxin-NADP reductase